MGDQSGRKTSASSSNPNATGAGSKVSPIYWFISASALVVAVVMAFINIDLLALATTSQYFSTGSHTPVNTTPPALSLLAFHPSFSKIVGENATPRLIADLDWEAFHEAGVYSKKDNSLYVTSNYKNLADNINITVVSLDDYSITSTQFPNLWEANGGSTWYPPGADQSQTPPRQVYCDEGDFEHASALVSVDPVANTSEVLLAGFNGRAFASVNDVRQHPVTGDLWFTDAAYGYFQHFRPRPTMPQQVYRFEPATGVVQAVADGFQQPNGLEFSPDFRTLYVSDTGAQGFTQDPAGAASIYAFDVVDSRRLQNRRLFAYADNGFPDGVHCDTAGNVWAGCGDGVHVWNPEGVLLGKVHVGELSNNFAFAPGKLFVFANRRLWLLENVKAQGREVCKDFGVGC